MPRTADDPFAGVDLSGLSPSQRRTISEAARDFQDVAAGRKPTFARFDEGAALPSDGGTTFYVGHGYRLTILCSLSGFGELVGTVYGPVLVFDEDFAPGNTREIISTRFYTNEQLRALLKE
ncbi:hypothetical protein [Luteimonas aquatica]|uniref:hypothetical protein n=1 Tax=Luteimonas aquatica TaxID=450364 RepID=UPI001F56EEB3|nr:hypothetical protein [Luteimonas aquatica]